MRIATTYFSNIRKWLSIYEELKGIVERVVVWILNAERGETDIFCYKVTARLWSKGIVDRLTLCADPRGPCYDAAPSRMMVS